MSTQQLGSQLIHSIDKANAAIATFAVIEEELRAVRNGLADDLSKRKLAELLRLNHEIRDITMRRLEEAKAQLALLKTQQGSATHF